MVVIHRFVRNLFFVDVVYSSLPIDLRIACMDMHV